MFNSIMYVAADRPRQAVDLGSLAESLIFYRKVILVGDRHNFDSVLATVPPLLLSRLISEERLDFHLIPDVHAIQKSVRNGRAAYEQFNLSIQEDVHAFLEKTFLNRAGNNYESRRAARNFLENITHIPDASRKNRLANDMFVRKEDIARILANIIKNFAPQYIQKSQVIFNAEYSGGAFLIESNLDFERINSEARERGAKTVLSVDQLMIIAQVALWNCEYAASLDTNLICHETLQSIPSDLLVDTIGRGLKDNKKIEEFLSYTLIEGPAIRETVNSNRVPFQKILKIISDADKFRAWLDRLPTDANILQEYTRASTRLPWTADMPTKVYRFAMFYGLSQIFAGPIAGLGLSLFDTFVLERIAAGWTPNQFLEGRLAKIIDPTDTRHRQL